MEFTEDFCRAAQIRIGYLFVSCSNVENLEIVAMLVACVRRK